MGYRWAFSSYNQFVELMPTSPSGNSQRKLRAYAIEIERLRSEGYTYPSIFEALKIAGVLTSLSAVKREGLRSSAVQSKPKPSALQKPATLPPSPASVLSVKVVQPSVLDAFFQSGFDNPLFKKRKL